LRRRLDRGDILNDIESPWRCTVLTDNVIADLQARPIKIAVVPQLAVRLR
jgi:hypothetical protein